MSLAAVGIAAHEAGNALQDAEKSSRMSLWNAAVGMANFGSGFGVIIFMVGLAFALQPLTWVGILLFGGTVLFEVLNLPLEIDVGNRAKAQIVELGIVSPREMPASIRCSMQQPRPPWPLPCKAIPNFYYASFLTGGSDE